MFFMYSINGKKVWFDTRLICFFFNGQRIEMYFIITPPFITKGKYKLSTYFNHGIEHELIEWFHIAYKNGKQWREKGLDDR